ncbi:hypothetical protein ANOM_004170 [Aspergillus nomiae NRRL 13137]|uniref:DUF5872 domain-containing protein n=1 Tax=Aspergillus nomiae NRRL (strain ATCC 15546 / NRRL 13137 / CBS 260.88 / M93) TaxID=1509407 RepID=A0A0L1J739_ASPN3|nr:uncharacterized protein ANOM_004170 [Aspergillus nomiae NRRL 13137]KNG87475.1 hypothetical protein ANOM_004170 [Aspergillus nomiae NRRL 13137]
MPANDDKYTDPELREQVKEEVKQSDKGGKPGQWSARKAQFMASEYKKRGGDYTTSKEEGQDESQKSLEQWGKEEWQTKEGSGTAKQEDGTRKRYLPKKAWEKMSEKEKEETEKKKQKGSKKGKQFVSNTSKAKRERKQAAEESRDEDQQESEGEESGSDEAEPEESDGSGEVDGNDIEEEQVGEGEGEENENEGEKQNGESEDQDGHKTEAGNKRTASQEEGANKKPRTRQDSKAEREQEE